MPTQLKGSFRGVPFGLLAHSMESGRRTVTHEFPSRDNPYVEDLGLRARSFSLDLFVLGDDSAARDALQKALEQKGPGVLVHPYLGTFKVQVGSFTLSESYDAQRLAKFTVGFLQPGTLEFPTTAVNASATVSAASTAASLRAGANASAIDTRHSAATVALTSLVSSVASSVQTSAKRAALPSTGASNADKATSIQLMSPYVRDTGNLPSMVATPDLMSYAFADVVFRLSGLGMTSLQAFYAYQRLHGDTKPMFAGLNFPATAIGATMASNASLFQDVVLVAIVGSAAASAVDADFTTLDQALAVRDALAAMFDDAMSVVTDDTLFGYLQDLRAGSLTQIPNPDQALPNVVKVTVSAAAPSLVLAHDLMSGSADEQTIIDLNGAGNPWFVPSLPAQPVLILK